MWSWPYIVWVRQEQPSVSCEQRSHIWVIGNAEQVVMVLLSSHGLSLSVATGESCSISQPRDVYNVAGFLQKEENPFVNGSHFSPNLQSWR